MTTTIERPDIDLRTPTRSVRAFPLWRRGATLTVETVLYLIVTLVVAIVEYFLGGPLTDFGLSNWWIGAIVYGAFEGYSWPGGQSFAMAITGSSVQLDDGRHAGPVRMAIRQTLRFVIL